MKPLLIVSAMWAIGGCVGRYPTEEAGALPTGEDGEPWATDAAARGQDAESDAAGTAAKESATDALGDADLDEAYAGLATDDEQPMFGEGDIYEAIDENAEDPAAYPDPDHYPDPDFYPTPEESLPDPNGMYPDPDKYYDVVVLWGQLQFNSMVTESVNWNGRFSVPEGRIGVMRTVRFEGRDRVVPCATEDHVAFRSHTRSHHDGLYLRVAVPANSAAALSMDTEAYSCEFPLEEGISIRDIDDNGNRVAVAIFRADPAVCARGLVGGAWHGFDGNRQMGLFRGRWLGAGGRLDGIVRGVYGTRVSPSRRGPALRQVFFGKVIDPDGTFRALLAGHYGEGEFHGRWLGRNFEHLGVLHGRTIETMPGDALGGFFLGTWREYCPGEEPSADDRPVQ